MMWGYYNPWVMLLGMFAQALVSLIVLGALLWLVVRLMRGRGLSHWQPLSGPSSIEILRQRYARGEIDAATYDEMRSRLAQSAADTAPRQSTTV